MNSEEQKRTINRDFIGVVKEVNDHLKYEEVDIPQETILIEEIEGMKENNNRTLMDVQQLFTESYPVEQFQHKHYNYLFPHKYSSAYVNGVDYPKILTDNEYKTLLDEHEKMLRDEEYFFKHCDKKEEQNKPKKDSEEKFKERIEKIVNKKMRDYVLDLREGFKYKRFIFAHKYTEKLKDIKNEPNVKMWSTDKIGWKKFKYVVNNDITVHVKSNFGYGSASYFFCNLKYKDVNILPYSAVIKYYNVKMIDFIRHTRRYETERSSWKEVFDFVVLTANMARHEPDRFVKEWIVNEVEKMMQVMRHIMSSPNEVLEKHLEFNQKVEIGDYHIFKNCSTIDIIDYKVFPKEKVMAFKTEKVTGCLLLLDNLRKLTEIAPVIVPYINEIEQMNLRIKPEIDTHIDSLKSDINMQYEGLRTLNVKIKKLVSVLEDHKESIEEVREEMNKKINEGRKYTHVELGTFEAEQKYKTTHPEYVKTKTEYNELKKEKEKKLQNIERRRRFLEILIECSKRIAKYTNVA